MLCGMRLILTADNKKVILVAEIVCVLAVVGIKETETYNPSARVCTDGTSDNGNQGMLRMKSFLNHGIHKIERIRIFPMTECYYSVFRVTVVCSGIFDETTKSFLSTAYSFNDS